MNLVLIFISLFLGLFSCTIENNQEGESFKKTDNDVIQIKLPEKLREISGLATSNDGLLFTLTDEIGTIYKIDPNNGRIIKKFHLGKWSVKDDFEGITTDGDKIFAITSSGKLFEFKEGKNNNSVDYSVTELPFSSKFNIEGLFFDEDTNSLLIASKSYPGKKYKDKRAIYEYNLSTRRLSQEARFVIDLKQLKKNFKIKSFYPSGIAKHPLTKNYYIISARGQNALVILDRNGKVINAYELSEKIHKQPEGITFMKDGTMIISDEGKNKKATLSIYKYQYHD